MGTGIKPINNEMHNTSTKGKQVKKLKSEADSEEGVTIGLIDAIIAICEVLSSRDMFDDNGLIQEAIKDIRSNDTIKMLMDIGELQDAKDYIQEQKKTIKLLCDTNELVNKVKGEKQQADIDKPAKIYLYDAIGGDLEEIECKADAEKFVCENYMEDGEVHIDVESIIFLKKIGGVKVTDAEGYTEINGEQAPNVKVDYEWLDETSELNLQEENKKLREALEKIAIMKRNGDEDWVYPFNRCYHIASNALDKPQ